MATRTEDLLATVNLLIEAEANGDTEQVAILEAAVLGRARAAASDPDPDPEPAEPTIEAQAKAQVTEQTKMRAYQVKAENEIVQAAAKASNVEGVTPETVMLQDPDAVLAVLASQSS